MNASAIPKRFRLLIVDDNPAIHDDIRKILAGRLEADQTFAEAKNRIFGRPAPMPHPSRFDLDSAYQGAEAEALVQEAVRTGQPYSIAFVDVRMPPGWDGIETISHLWAAAPDLQIVLCTAYSDYSWEEIFQKLGKPDSLVILKKPFDNIEVTQIAHALTEKWQLIRALGDPEPSRTGRKAPVDYCSAGSRRFSFPTWRGMEAILAGDPFNRDRSHLGNPGASCGLDEATQRPSWEPDQPTSIQCQCRARSGPASSGSGQLNKLPICFIQALPYQPQKMGHFEGFF